MRSEVSQSKPRLGRVGQDEGSPSKGKAREMCGKVAGPLGLGQRGKAAAG